MTMAAGFVAVQLGACGGSRPGDLGVRDGRFKPCPESPNCVSSFEAESDTEHYIDPIAARGGVPALQELSAIISRMPRTEIVRSTDDYLYVEFTSFFWRFIDDVEFAQLEDGGPVHVRSASRKGKGDLGVNRERIDELRRRYRRGQDKR